MQKSSKIHETWHSIMGRHQHAMVNFLSHLGKIWVSASHKPETLTTSMMVSVENVPPLWTKRFHCLLLLSKNFSWQHRTTGVLCQFLWFSGYVWTFSCINWVFNAFMCIIQIWNTCTSSSAYKLVEKSNLGPWMHAQVHARNGNEFQKPGHRWLPAKHWDAWF